MMKKLCEAQADGKFCNILLPLTIEILHHLIWQQLLSDYSCSVQYFGLLLGIIVI